MPCKAIAFKKSFKYNDFNDSLQRCTSILKGMKKVTGKVKWFSAEKGYGFIECAGYGEIFVHFSNIRMPGFRALIGGREVEFELIRTERGFQAINVTPVKELL